MINPMTPGTKVSTTPVLPMARTQSPVSCGRFANISLRIRTNRILGKKQDTILDSQSQIHEKGKRIGFTELFFSKMCEEKNIHKSIIFLNFYNRPLDVIIICLILRKQ